MVLVESVNTSIDGFKGNTASGTFETNTPIEAGEHSEQAKESTTKILVNNNPKVNDLDIISQKHSQDGFSNIPKFDISDLSNETIAYYVKQRLEGNPIEGIEKGKYFFLMKLVEYSEDVEGSNLYQLFLDQCKSKKGLIEKLGKT